MKYAIAFFLHVGAALVLSAGGIAVEGNRIVIYVVYLQIGIKVKDFYKLV